MLHIRGLDSLVSSRTYTIFGVIMFQAFRLLVLCFATLLGQFPSFAQTYPAKPIRLIVPFPPGAGTDALARAISARLTENLGQPVIVENHPGAGATLGTDIVAKAAPDGYTMLLATTSHAINPSIYAKLPFDTLKDFSTVTEVATVPTVLLVHPTVPANTLAEFIALAKANPGAYSMSSSGSGTIFHLAGELFKNMAGIDFVHVPYSGGGPAMYALVGGHVNLLFETTLTALPQLKAGKVKALAAGSPQRIPSLPDLPTFAESGFPSFAAENWYGIYVPAKTPRSIVVKLNKEIVKVLQTQAMRDNFGAQGVQLVGNTPEEHETFLKAEIAKWSRIAKIAHAKAD